MFLSQSAETPSIGYPLEKALQPTGRPSPRMSSNGCTARGRHAAPPRTEKSASLVARVGDSRVELRYSAGNMRRSSSVIRFLVLSYELILDVAVGAP